MMNNSIINWLLTAVVFISPLAMAENIFCPAPEAIKAGTFSTVEKGDHPGIWTLIQTGQFKTSQNWKFSLIVEAKDRSMALKKAKIALAKIRKTHGPEKVDNVWVCDYKAPSSMMAIATTSPQ